MSEMMKYIIGDDQSELALLKAQLEHMGGALSREIELCAKADAEVKRLREALEPFAIVAERIPANYHPTLIVRLEIKGSSALNRAELTVADLVAAKATLSASSPHQPSGDA